MVEPLKKKPPRDTEHGFRHVVIPIVVMFAAMPPGCGVAMWATGGEFTFGLYAGLALLTFTLLSTFSVMIRRR